MESQEILSPPKVQATLDRISVDQKELIERRDKMLEMLTTYDPSSPQFTFESWAAEVEEIQESWTICIIYSKKAHNVQQSQTTYDLSIRAALDIIKEEFMLLANKLSVEEDQLRYDLEEIVDPDDIERMMEPLVTQAESIIKAHYVDFRQLNLNFKSLR